MKIYDCQTDSDGEDHDGNILCLGNHLGESSL